jgi:hypothetical protein
MKQWTVTMTDHDEYDDETVYAHRCGVQEAGELFFADEDDGIIAIYAPGTWFKVEAA